MVKHFRARIFDADVPTTPPAYVRVMGLALLFVISACGATPTAPEAQLEIGQDTIGPLAAGILPAFPEAEGFGATSLASCRSGGVEVLPVTSLEDSGPGSMRDALERARNDVLSVIVFRVGGYLDLSDRIELSNKACIYIAGQTAPGDGVTIRWDHGSAFFTKRDSHDIVIRHIRFRGDWMEGTNHLGHVAIHIGSGTDYVLDHVSMSWTADKTLVITKADRDWSEPIYRVSVQRSIVSEVLSTHPTGGQISGEKENGATEWKNIGDISLHRNLFAHNSHRNPNVTTMGTEVINNVVYNWKQGAVQSTRGSKLDVVANYFKPGPMTDSRYLYEVTWRCGFDDGFEPSLYVAGNIGPHNSQPGQDNWIGDGRVTACYYTTGDYPEQELPERFRRGTPLAPAQWPVVQIAGTSVLDDVLADVGANAGVTCEGKWIRRADAVDQRVLEEVRSGTGTDRTPQSAADAGGFPPLRTMVTECPDQDNDGMPDAFETLFGLNQTSSDDAAFDRDQDGYSNVEEYVNATNPTKAD